MSSYGLSIITVIIAALGVQQYLTIEDMKKKQKEVEELKANIEKEVNAAKALTSSAKGDLQSMSKLIQVWS